MMCFCCNTQIGNTYFVVADNGRKLFNIGCVEDYIEKYVPNYKEEYFFKKYVKKYDSVSLNQVPLDNSDESFIILIYGFTP